MQRASQALIEVFLPRQSVALVAIEFFVDERIELNVTAMNALDNADEVFGNNFVLSTVRTIQSDSRAVGISDGDSVFVINTGSILGTGNQCSGTLCIDSTVDKATITSVGLVRTVSMSETVIWPQPTRIAK